MTLTRRLGALLLTIGLVTGPSAKAACVSSKSTPYFLVPLAHMAERVHKAQSLTIIAIGSSSTYGTGASAPDRSYPAQLQQLLATRFPEITVRVVNKGVPGEDTDQMIERFDRDVVAEHPDLVIWQVGTNTIVQDRPVGDLITLIERAIERLKATGADVVLMDPQYAPEVLSHADHDEVVADVDAAANDEHIDLFPRFAIMKRWVTEGGFTVNSMLAPDGLHMNDESYACLASTLADAIQGASHAGTDIARNTR
jgi:acyl-CoA thioesterase-1